MCTADANAGVLLYMQQNVRKPLRALRPDNYATFAELFTTALLQAAATGETLLDKSESTQKLQQLADKDTAKFYRLNQRMQVWFNHMILRMTPGLPALNRSIAMCTVAVSKSCCP